MVTGEYHCDFFVSFQGLVLDEVDVLLGEQGAFDAQVSPLLEQAPPLLRLVLVTATLPEAVFNQLTDRWPQMAAALGPNLHKIGSGTGCKQW